MRSESELRTLQQQQEHPESVVEEEESIESIPEEVAAAAVVASGKDDDVNVVADLPPVDPQTEVVRLVLVGEGGGGVHFFCLAHAG